MLTSALLVLGAAGVAANTPAHVLPTSFEADRVYVVPETTDGKRLRLYTDTGGGQFLTESAVKRLGLRITPAPEPESADESGDGGQFAAFPEQRSDRSIPLPSDADRFWVMPAEMVRKQGFDIGDGLLGQAWFDGHVWTWDYPGERLTLEGSDWTPSRTATRVALGFRTGEEGKRETGFPRMTIHVDGKPIDVLLDTGATTTLTPAALKVLADGGPADRATSMIVDTQFKAWQKAHPDWRVIEGAQAGTHSAMIEVPAVEIGGATVGPVWFTHRPDTNFHDYMSGMMDARVEGAIGGNALGHFVMTIDYPGAAAYFRCTKDCGVTRRQPANPVRQAAAPTVPAA